MRDPREKVLEYGYFSEDGFHRYPDAPAVPAELRHMVRDNPLMALTSKEKQEAFRARQAMLGMTEVRGIFLPPAMHAELKAVAEKMQQQIEKTKDKK